MCLCMWFGVFKTSFSKLPQYSSTWKTGIVQPREGSDIRVKSHLMWNKELKTLDYLHVSLHMIWGIWVPKLPQHLSTCETGIIWLTEDLDTRKRSHLMWNKELRTLNFFSCDSLLDLGVFGPFFPKIL